MDIATAANVLHDYARNSVCRKIHPQDGMWIGGEAWYFPAGEAGLRACIQALTLSQKAVPNRIMDLPCGHGRVARHLRAAFPQAEMFFCDLDAEGIAFCTATFGGTAILSAPDLSSVELPNDIDLIWVGSLFTHIDRVRAERWLAYLSAHLSADGVLVATFHGPWSIEKHKQHAFINDKAWSSILDQFDRTGFGYAPYTEYNLGDYGVSLCRPSAVVEMVDRIEKVRLIGYMERGWGDNHDVVMIARTDRFAPERSLVDCHAPPELRK